VGELAVENVIYGKIPDGSGSGSGYGSGYGYGSGDGSGYGYGSGDGSGSGYGYGDGDGSKEYRVAVIDTFASLWPEPQRDRLANLRNQGATIAFWKSNRHAKPCNGGTDFTAFTGLVQEVQGPLALHGPHALHATLNPHQWKGERLWIVALLGKVVEAEHKLGALKREILGEAIGPQPHNEG